MTGFPASMWLVGAGKLTRYQAAVLAAGRPGPFVFGPLVIQERIEDGRFARRVQDADDS